MVGPPAAQHCRCRSDRDRQRCIAFEADTKSAGDDACAGRSGTRGGIERNKGANTTRDCCGHADAARGEGFAAGADANDAVDDGRRLAEPEDENVVGQ